MCNFGGQEFQDAVRNQYPWDPNRSSVSNLSSKIFVLKNLSLFLPSKVSNHMYVYSYAAHKFLLHHPRVFMGVQPGVFILTLLLYKLYISPSNYSTPSASRIHTTVEGEFLSGVAILICCNYSKPCGLVFTKLKKKLYNIHCHFIISVYKPNLF